MQVFSSSRNIFKKEGIPPHPIFKCKCFFKRWNHLLVVYFLVQPENSGILNVGGFECLGVSLTFHRWGAFISCNTKRTKWWFGVSCAFNVLNTRNYFSSHVVFGRTVSKADQPWPWLSLSELCALCNTFGRGSPVFLVILFMCCERLNIWVRSIYDIKIVN